MNSDFAGDFLPFYALAWISLVLISWLTLRSRISGEAKKRWSDRFIIIGGFLIFVFMASIFASHGRYFFIPLAFVLTALVVYLNIHQLVFCPACAESIRRENPFSRAPLFCQYCGHQVK